MIKIFLVLVSLLFLGPIPYDFYSKKETYQTYYGAIAYSYSTRRWGMSGNLPTREDAESRATVDCAERDCRIVVSFNNSCGALASDENGVIGWAIGFPEDHATRLAVDNCYRNGGRACRILCSVCTKQ